MWCVVAIESITASCGTHTLRIARARTTAAETLGTSVALATCAHGMAWPRGVARLHVAFALACAAISRLS